MLSFAPNYGKMHILAGWVESGGLLFQNAGLSQRDLGPREPTAWVPGCCQTWSTAWSGWAFNTLPSYYCEVGHQLFFFFSLLYLTILS